MSLPAKAPASDYLKKLKPKNLVLPVVVLAFIAVIIIIGVILPSQNNKSKDKSKDASVYTKSNKVKLDSGKEVELAPRVKQISPEKLSAAIASKDNITIIQVFSGEEWKEPRIAGSLLIRKSDFDTAPTAVDKASYNVYVSKDGYDSAEAISKLLNYAFSYDNNVNLEGGLKAWKDKGYALQP